MADAFAGTLSRFGGGPRAATVLVGLGAVAAIWGFVHWGMSPRYVPIASGLPIERVGEATQRLEEAGIDFELARGGQMITVPDRLAAEARVLLAQEGLTGTTNAPGFEIFDKPSWGMTDFTQRVNYRRALEGELQRTLTNMRGVQSAEVHLALREASFLASSDETGEASVVIRLNSGATPDGAFVEGVQSLVASAVEGLTESKVSVLDDRGRLLSTADAGTGIGRSSAQLKVRRQTEQYLEGKAQAIVARVVGPGNVTVRVAAELNFDQIDRTIQAVDPDQQILVREDRAEITPGNEEQGAGSITTNSEYETTRSIETFSSGSGKIERLSVAVVVSERRVEQDDGTFQFVARTPEELLEVETLVRHAVGLSTARGDEITVVSSRLEPPVVQAPPSEALDVAGILLAAQRPVVSLAGLAVALFLALRILGTIKTMKPTAPLPQLGTHPEPALPPPPEPEAISAPAAGPAVQIANPELTARVLKSWMGEA